MAPPARQSSSASPGRKVRSRTSSDDTGTLQTDAREHRIVTAPDSGRGKIRRHRHHKDVGHGRGHGDGQGKGNGNGDGQGKGNGNGQGNAPTFSILR